VALELGPGLAVGLVAADEAGLFTELLLADEAAGVFVQAPRLNSAVIAATLVAIVVAGRRVPSGVVRIVELRSNGLWHEHQVGPLAGQAGMPRIRRYVSNLGAACGRALTR